MAEEKLVQTQDNVEAVNETPVKTRVSTENNKLSFKQKVIYDLKNNRIYRVEGNPSRKQFKEDTRMKFK